MQFSDLPQSHYVYSFCGLTDGLESSSAFSQYSDAEELDEQPLHLPIYCLLISLLVVVLSVYLLAQVTMSPPMVRYRVCNGTSVPLNNVHVLGFKNLRLEVGEFSAYVEGSGLFSEVGVSVNANGKNLDTTFDDHFGEPLLPKGDYTIAIVLEDSSRIRAIRAIRAVVSDGSQCKATPPI